MARHGVIFSNLHGAALLVAPVVECQAAHEADVHAHRAVLAATFDAVDRAVRDLQTRVSLLRGFC